MKFKKALLTLCLVSSCVMVAMDEPESWTCEIFPYMKELFKGAIVSLKFNCNQADASDKLMTAIKQSNPTLVATILQEHPRLVDVAEDNDGVTPLLAATIVGDEAMVTQLLNRSPQPQVDRCAHQGFALVKKGNDGKTTWLPISGFTSLMAAAKFNYPDIAKQLLSARANKELKDFSNPGRTALDYAKENGNIKMINLLT